MCIPMWSQVMMVCAQKKWKMRHGKKKYIFLNEAIVFYCRNYYNQYQRKQTILIKIQQWWGHPIMMVLAPFAQPKSRSFTQGITFAICAKYPNDYATRQLKNVTIIRDGIACTNKRDQWCYIINFEGIDHVLHIVTKLFHVNVPPLIIFDTEQ